MTALNTRPTFTETTYEGALAHPAALKPEAALRRAVMSCLLWEREFYEDGVSIAERIVAAVTAVPLDVAAQVAVEARTTGNLRHVPLLIAAAMARRGGSVVGKTIAAVIRRADELAEFVAIYSAINTPKPGRTAAILSKQAKVGLRRAFARFDEYQLAKYDRAKTIRLRDVLRLVHPKPVDAAQEALWGRLNNGTLATPDTWEVALSGGADKRETFERLIRESNLGYLALLRNLRNMATANVDADLIRETILARRNGAEKVLPFRFIAAARAAPQFELELNRAMTASIEMLPRLSGETVVLVDVSGSMDTRLSARSDLTRMDAAAGLASIVNAEKLRVYSFSERVVEVPPRRGMAGVDAITRSQPNYRTYLGRAVTAVSTQHPAARLIVITDEQSHDRVPAPLNERAYLINVASTKNGVGYGRPWVHIDGFSESVLTFIAALEQEDARGRARARARV